MFRYLLQQLGSSRNRRRGHDELNTCAKIETRASQGCCMQCILNTLFVSLYSNIEVQIYTFGS